MSAPKVFVTGVTGYVGGDALYVIMAAHPDWHYSLLVRDSTRLVPLIEKYPSTRVLIGDLTDSEKLKEESAAADIVLNFATSDDTIAVQAIIDGLRSDSSKTRFLIQTSGSGDVLWENEASGIAPGDGNPRVWDDIADHEALVTMPETALHRPVEKLVLEAGDGHAHLKTAVIVPPSIVGAGRGPANRRSLQIPALAEFAVQRGKAFQIGAGKAVWGMVHVQDLSHVYLRVVEAASEGGAGADWGRDGFYFAQAAERELGEVTKILATSLHGKGVLKSAEIESISAEEATKMFYSLVDMAGRSSRSRASRARKVLSWSPKLTDFDKIIEEDVLLTLKASQTRLEELMQGHAPAQARSA